MEVVRRADVVVATRFHGTVLALHAERAVLGVCYQLKAIQLLEEMDQKEYAFNLDDFRTEDLKRGFHRLAGNLEAQLEKIRQRHAEYQHALDEQYGNVLRLLA
jgi:polysaccharide pyruvyl transferase WcaK-like protein